MVRGKYNFIMSDRQWMKEIKAEGQYKSEWFCAYGNIWGSPRSVQWSGRGWRRVRGEVCGASRRGHIRILCQLSTYNEATAPQANWWFPPPEDQCCYTHLTKRERMQREWWEKCWACTDICLLLKTLIKITQLRFCIMTIFDVPSSHCICKKTNKH